MTTRIGLGFGRAAQAFVKGLGERILGMAETVLVGNRDDFQLIEERRRVSR